MSNPIMDKAISLVQKKASSEQNILCFEKIVFITNKSHKRHEDCLIITSHNLYFISIGAASTSIKKVVPNSTVNYLTLAILGIEMIIHCGNGEWLRIQSNNIVKIIGNILLAKEKFLNEKVGFAVHLEIQRTLEAFVDETSLKKSFWNIFSSKKPQVDKSTGKPRSSMQSNNSRTSFSTIEVSERNFTLEIGKMVYKAIFVDCDLLYISGEGIQGFRFDAENYKYLDIDNQTTLYYKSPDDKIKYIRYKIWKECCSDEGIKFLREQIKEYRYKDYGFNVLFGIEFTTHFELYLPHDSKNHFFCSQLLEKARIIKQTEQSQVSSEKSIGENNSIPLSSPQQLFSEVDLRSIFYKLYDFVKDQSEKGNILYSLSPQDIYVGNGDVRIFTLSSVVQGLRNISYLSPEQIIQIGISQQSENLHEQKPRQEEKDLKNSGEMYWTGVEYQDNSFSELETFKINIWKIGMLLYELSYGTLPFPIEYLAFKIKYKDPIKINFPQNDSRTSEFQHFLKSLLCKDPLVRGMKLKGENTRTSVINPYITDIKSHDWIKRANI